MWVSTRTPRFDRFGGFLDEQTTNGLHFTYDLDVVHLTDSPSQYHTAEHSSCATVRALSAIYRVQVPAVRGRGLASGLVARASL